MKKLTLLLIFSVFILYSKAQDLMLNEYKTLSGFDDNVSKFRFSPKSNYFTVGTVINQTKLYDKEFNEIWSYQGQGRFAGSPTAFTLDENYLVFGKYMGYGDVAVLRMSDKKIVQRLKAFEDYVNDLEFSPNGKMLVAAGAGNQIKVWKWNQEKFENLTELPYNQPDSMQILTLQVEDVAFSPDGKYLVAVGNLRQLLIYEVSGENFKLIQNIKCKNTANSVVFHPKGKYFITNGVNESGKAVCFELQKGKFVQKSEFDLASGSMDDSDFDTEGKVFAATMPRGFQLFSFKEGITKEIDQLQVHNGYVLGLDFSADKNFLVSAATDRKVIFWALPDAPITKVVKNETKGENPPPKKDIKKNEPTKNNENHDLDFDLSKTGKNYLLIIGIDKYKHWKPLTNPTHDAKEIKKVLVARYGFEPNQVFELYDNEATLKNIITKINDVRNKISDEDNLLIYFSGHGHYNSTIDEGFWVPVDAKKGEETEYLANSTLIKYIKSMSAKHIFLVADACFSGALFASDSRGGSAYAENVGKIKSRWGLTSGMLEYVSDGDEGKNSPFATYFLKFLQENEKESVPVTELIQYVKEAVANNSEQTPKGSHLKNVGDEGGEFIFRLKKLK